MSQLELIILFYYHRVGRCIYILCGCLHVYLCIELVFGFEHLNNKHQMVENSYKFILRLLFEILRETLIMNIFFFFL
jgi:hypothetical protein